MPPKGLKPPSVEGLAFFEKKIRPVLVRECYSCHSAEAAKPKAGFRLDTSSGIRKGGETGPGVIPGDAKGSLVIKAIKHLDKELTMPPMKKLSNEIIADFEKWIEIGCARSARRRCHCCQEGDRPRKKSKNLGISTTREG